MEDQSHEHASFQPCSLADARRQRWSSGPNCCRSPANQAAAPFTAANAVGHWLHDPQGNVIGSVRALANGGRIVVIMVGPYFGLGSHEARFPVRALSLAGGKVTLQAETVEAMSVRLQ